MNRSMDLIIKQATLIANRLLVILQTRLNEKQSFGFMFIMAAALNAFIIIIYGEAFKVVEHFAQQIFQTHPLIILGIAPILFLTAWYINTIKFPLSGGSGIPQILTATEVDPETVSGRKYLKSALAIRTAVAKMIGSLLVVLNGGAIGREGPSLHISANIFFLFHRILNVVHKSLDYRSWVIAGAAAGLAAAFNTPLGGIVYAIEELGSLYFTKIKNNLLLAVLVSGVASQAILGSYLFIGSPSTNPYNIRLLVLVCIFAALAGLAGAMFGQFIYFATKFRHRVQSKKLQIVMVFIISLLIYSIAYYDQYSIGAGKEYISSLLFKNADQSPLTIPFRIINTFLIYITGVAGGIFAPSLALGAGLGFYAGQVLDAVMNFTNPTLFILCGMVSFLTGVTRTPLTAFILVMEMTDRHASIIPLMLAAFTSIVAAKLFNQQGFYELTVKDFLKKVNDAEAELQAETSKA